MYRSDKSSVQKKNNLELSKNNFNTENHFFRLLFGQLIVICGVPQRSILDVMLFFTASPLSVNFSSEYKIVSFKIVLYQQ